MRTYPGHWAPHLRPEKHLSKHNASHGSTTNTPPTSSFLSLPRELRDEIYSYFIPSTLSFTMQNQHRSRHRYRSPPQTFPYYYFLAESPLLLVNHQLRFEFLSAIYHTTTFCFEWRRRSTFILHCLEKVPPEAKARIRRLAWKDQSLHTGGEARTVKGWGTVMQYVATQFTDLRTVHCYLASGEDGRHRYHNWEVPRLAAGLLAEGRIDEICWFWKGQIYSFNGVPVEEILRVAITLFEIPRVEERDGEMGFEYRRLVCEERVLDGGSEVDRWAMECRGRKRHEFDVRRVESSRTMEEHLVFRRRK